MRSLRNQNGFTLVEVVIVGGIIGVLALLMNGMMSQTFGLQRSILTRAQLTEISGSVHLLLEDRCSCEKSGLKDVVLNPSNPKEQPLALVSGGVEFATEGQVISNRKIDSVRVVTMIPLAAPAPPAGLYLASLQVKTSPANADEVEIRDGNFSVPLKIELDALGRVVSCYSRPTTVACTP